ncbi:Ribonuclease H domain [Sesbania bispinosa]|nr:Ribonuclease H domain [Sesbania bispinosa]
MNFGLHKVAMNGYSGAVRIMEMLVRIKGLEVHFRQSFVKDCKESWQHNFNIKWIPPSPESIALNVDGSSLGNPGPAGYGGVLRNTYGQWLKGFHGSVGVSEILQAEQIGILENLKIAWEDGYRSIECWSD